ncbi:dihydroxyacetone kinase family protein [Ruania alkalisoli]|uniref:Dihydroxyacetone kinase family protein n=1 Tax=Ruania alkalisoli TaxID=2779775 RepID=A0A7M1SUB4_9MICO|nr:dihydroxyacetone kinase family protein [Ruania alkalisoli]QOR71176.1 dihydroxyacetone kinase family protein [Ruania alkalisoli]
MTTVFNDPTQFAQEMLSGFCRLHADTVQPVTGGCVRATETPEGKVAVVIGGGSGHYPAFAGWVGPGMADGAVVGNVFASPSAQQVHAVAKAAQRGGGVFLSYGNYAGDVLNFNLAQERLNAEGIPTRTVVVADDITSASAEERHKRRGTTGDLVVFKIAGAAAEAGYDLDGVVEVAQRANDATYSFAVAFAGCTLPGDPDPLFTVPKGRMGVGMGVHGEPGIAEEDVLPAADLARMLVEKVLTERPDGARRAAVLVNGLGGTKYEEMFVLWNDIAPLLEDAGVEIVAPEVGELITSLDMAGVSLTLFWLDEELERLWVAPAQTPAFRRGSAITTTRRDPAAIEDATAVTYPEATTESQASARALLAIGQRVAAALHEHETELGKLDSIAGDGDHGRGMTNGADAALKALTEAVEAGAGAASALAAAGDAWGDRAGGTSGALWGAGLRAAAGALADDSAVTGAQVRTAVRAALEHILSYGKAERGDKTLLDALIPFTEALEQDESELAQAWAAAAQVATTEADATADLTPRIGRARPLAERSIGHPDPGAISLALVMRTAAR